MGTALCSCFRVNATEHHWSQINIDSGNGLVSPGKQAIAWAIVDPYLCRHTVQAVIRLYFDITSFV